MVCRQLGNEYPDVTYVECNLKAPFTKAYCCRSRSSNSLHNNRFWQSTQNDCIYYLFQQLPQQKMNTLFDQLLKDYCSLCFVKLDWLIDVLGWKLCEYLVIYFLVFVLLIVALFCSIHQDLLLKTFKKKGNLNTQWEV